MVAETRGSAVTRRIARRRVGRRFAPADFKAVNRAAMALLPRLLRRWFRMAALKGALQQQIGGSERNHLRMG